jgi:serine/threonine-protein kinase
MVAVAILMRRQAAPALPVAEGAVDVPSAPPTTRRVAVLPFEQEELRPVQAHWGEQMAGEIAAKLASIPDLRVLPRHSVRSLSGAADPLVTARGIHLDAVVKGTIRRSDTDLHATVELIDTRDGFLRWSQSYDVPAGEVFAVQTDCVLKVAEALEVPLPETLCQQLAQSATRDLCAYDSYLLGRRYLDNRTPTDFLKAVEFFQAAVAADSQFALAHAGLAEAYQYLGYGFGSVQATKVAPKARDAAHRAVELDSDLAEAHTALAIVHTLLDWDWDRAEQEFQQALRLNPRCPGAHHFYGLFLAAVRQRFGPAVAEASLALELDPLSLPLNNFLGVALYFAGRLPEVIEHQQHWMTTVPKPSGADHELGFGHKMLGRAHEGLRQEAEAVECYLRELVLHGVPKSVIEEQQAAFGHKGWQGFWKVRTSGLEALWDRGGQPWFVAYEIALGRTRLEDWDSAFTWLNRLLKARCGLLVWLEVDPLLAPLLRLPQGQDLLQAIGLQKGRDNDHGR